MESFRLGTVAIEEVFPEKIFTGLVDQHGNKIWKTYARYPIGFIHWPEE